MDGGSQEDEFQTNYMGEGGHARIYKKKRKKILKSNTGSKIEGIELQGMVLQCREYISLLAHESLESTSRCSSRLITYS